MKSINTYKKTLGFLTAAMTFAAVTSGCSNKNNSSSDKAAPETTLSTEAETVPGSLEADRLSDIRTSYSDLFSGRDLDPSYDSVTAEITLTDDTAEINGTGASVSGSVVTISNEGIYCISGTLNDGQIVVNAKSAKVQLVLDNASIACSTAAPIYIADDDKTFITLAEGSENSVTDGRTYAYSEENPDVTDSAVFSEDSLTINGSGKLTVNGNYYDGIHSKDDIVITGGTLVVTAVNNGIKGKDYVAAAGGNVTVTAGNDGIKSTNTDDLSLGFIYIGDGSFSITSDGDGFQAETVFAASGGTVNVTAGGGSTNSSKSHNDDFGGKGGGFGGGKGGGKGDFGGRGEFGDFEMPTDENGIPAAPGDMPPGGFGGMDFGDFAPGGGYMSDTADLTNLANTTVSDSTGNTSTKGIKAGTLVNISGGEFSVNSADDALHSNGSMIISGGSLSLETGDKGIHADTQLDISDSAYVTVTKSYEGIEAAIINVSGGTIEVTSSDDGFNASDGSSQGAMGSNSNGVSLNISGGTVYVNADGDGLDSNGSMIISGGTVLVDGPVNGGNGALDSNGEIKVTGGLLIAAGSSGMAESPGSSSTQNSVSAAFETSMSGGTLVTLTDRSGSEILSYAPAKTFNHIVISSADIKTGESYTFYTGGTSSSSKTYGLYENGGYKNDGTEAGSFTADSVTSYIGSQGMMGGQGGFGGGHGGHGGGPGGYSGGDRGDFSMGSGFEMPTDENGDPLSPDDFHKGGRGKGDMPDAVSGATQ